MMQQRPVPPSTASAQSMVVSTDTPASSSASSPTKAVEAAKVGAAVIRTTEQEQAVVANQEHEPNRARPAPMEWNSSQFCVTTFLSPWVVIQKASFNF